MMKLRNVCAGMLAAGLLFCLPAAAETPRVKTRTVGTMDVTVPAGAGRLPVVFLAHNGNGKKEDWRDFPAELAARGYVVVNMGWTDFAGSADLRKDIGVALRKFGKRIDPERAAFIGGCHGGVKLIDALKAGVPVTVKSIVLLSLSEGATLPDGHAPALGIYSVRDHLGEFYVRTQKNVYSNLITEPKKVVELDAIPHGNELAVDQSTKDGVRGEIYAALAGL